MGASVIQKFSPELARAVMAKVQSQCLSGRPNRYTAEQIIEIERHISALRKAGASMNAEKRLS
jgi:hypothetical protein